MYICISLKISIYGFPLKLRKGRLDLCLPTKLRTSWGNLSLDSLLYGESNFTSFHTQKNFFLMLAPSIVAKNKVCWPAPCVALFSPICGRQGGTQG